MSGQAVLRVEGLHAGYGQVTVLRDVGLTVGDGEVALLLGANGAGKTTTLRAISGVIAATGTIEFEGRGLSGLGADAVARLGVAHVPQGRGTFTDFTVEENLAVGGYSRRDRAAVAADMRRWMEFFPVLGRRRHQQAGSMSGGEQQMLAIARALMSAPRLLLLDEPSLGLAPVVTREVYARLGELNRETGLAMVVVEQAAELALEIASRAYVLTSGRTSAGREGAAMRDADFLRSSYLGS